MVTTSQLHSTTSPNIASTPLLSTPTSPSIASTPQPSSLISPSVVTSPQPTTPTSSHIVTGPQLSTQTSPNTPHHSSTDVPLVTTPVLSSAPSSNVVTNPITPITTASLSIRSSGATSFYSTSSMLTPSSTLASDISTPATHPSTLATSIATPATTVAYSSTAVYSSTSASYVTTAVPNPNPHAGGAIVTTHASTPAENATCDCTSYCNLPYVAHPVNMTQELIEKIEEIKKELTVDKRQLSSATNKKISAPDDRPSAAAAGFSGCCDTGGCVRWNDYDGCSSCLKGGLAETWPKCQIFTAVKLSYINRYPFLASILVVWFSWSQQVKQTTVAPPELLILKLWFSGVLACVLYIFTLVYLKAVATVQGSGYSF